MPLGQLFLELGWSSWRWRWWAARPGGWASHPSRCTCWRAWGWARSCTWAAPRRNSFTWAPRSARCCCCSRWPGIHQSELRESLSKQRNIGALDLALNFPPGLIAGWLLGLPPMACVLLGGVTYLTSSGIASKVLSDLGRLGNRETPVILGVCVLEDVAMAVYLPVVAALLLGGTLVAIGVNLTVALGVFALTFFLALRYGHLLSRALNVPSDEALLLGVLGLVLVVAGAADLLKVSAAIGAFLVGIALSGEVADRARRQIEPLRDLFAAVFFVFFGLQLNLAEVPDVLLAATLLAVVTAATKFAVGWIGAARAGVQTRGRVRAGATLIARGEFSILIAGLGLGLAPQLGPLAAVYVLLTALIGPVLARFDAPIAAWLTRPARPAASS
nr:cation:proton antiporter [Deinococcus sp. LM3]